MRISKLYIRNFKAITDLSLEDLRETVVVAGPNGCGKSCLFDAIRLLKSAYGGYQQNEWHQWFGEFQINVNQGSSWLPLFQDRTRPLVLGAEFKLAPTEIQYVTRNAEQILTDQTWRELVPELAGWSSFGGAPLAANLRIHEPNVRRRVNEELPRFLEALRADGYVGELTISPDGRNNVRPSRVLEVVFSRYEPQHLGIIDYHGASRNYSREQLGGVNLNLENNEQRMRQHALYNYSNKYANLKSEMAGSFVRQLLATEAGNAAAADESLVATLRELFATFFPGKEFLGPRPTSDGRLQFPVRIATGAEHDIDDLSAGEKEVLYGYLRLRNAAPHNSVLLLDEPELHLNPRLVSGLAGFYNRHLSRPLRTQLWLVTHSDTLIREAVGQDGFSVFHLQPAGQYEGANQAAAVQVGADLDRLVVELVGDLAAYRPGAKIVVFEGDSDSGFDIRMTGLLFPRFQAAINAIGGGSKRRVSELYSLLEGARAAGHLPGKFYAITDADADGEISAGQRVPTRFTWDVYHIENYLLHPPSILSVLNDLNRAVDPVRSEVGVVEALRMCAAELTDQLVAHLLRVRVNRDLVAALSLAFDPGRHDISIALGEALGRTRERIVDITSNTYSLEALGQLDREYRGRFEADLQSDRWLRTFRGRDILKRFVGRHVSGVAYEAFRDLVLARMRDRGIEPEGMRQVVEAILTERIARCGSALARV